MRRYVRLICPGLAFAVIGGLLLALTPLPAFALKGGLVTSGVYALALQVVSSLLLLAAVDDLPDRAPGRPSSRRGQGSPVLGRPEPAADTRLALLHFYRWHPLPALLLAFGLATSLATLLIGLQPTPGSTTQAVLAVVLTASALAQLPKLAPGYLGWSAGFAAGSVSALMAFSRSPLGSTWLAWLALVGVLWSLWAGIYGLRVMRRRPRGSRRAEGQREPPPPENEERSVEPRLRHLALGERQSLGGQYPMSTSARTKAAAILLLGSTVSLTCAAGPAYASRPSAIVRTVWTYSGTYPNHDSCVAAGQANPQRRSWQCVASNVPGSYDLYLWY